MKKFNDKLDEVIRGEKSAIETYDQILEKFKSDIKGQSLADLKNDHVQAVSTLQTRLAIEGERPSESSGPWGGVAKTIMGTAKLFGNASALKALKEGEEHGLKEYKELLACDDLPSDVADIVRDNLLPKQSQHIDRIDELMRQAS